MRAAEEDGGEDERGRAAPGPVFNPLLEDTTEEELLGEREDEQEGQEVEGQFQRWAVLVSDNKKVESGDRELG